MPAACCGGSERRWIAHIWSRGFESYRRHSRAPISWKRSTARQPGRTGIRITTGRPMAFIDTNSLPVIERLPGWRGRYFHSPSMTFGHYEFARGASIHEHFHAQEEVWEVIEGELEVTIDGATQVAR